MIAYIVTEGALDAMLIRAVLPAEILEDVEIVAGDGYSSARSLIRSLLATRRTPTALVVDADSTSEKAVHRRWLEIDEVVGSATAGTPYEIILAVPEIEAVFFQNESVAQTLFGQNFSELELQLARLQPKETLQKLLQASGKSESEFFKSGIPPAVAESLRAADFFQKLIVFLDIQRKNASGKPELARAS
jgi:hypothetical protein